MDPSLLGDGWDVQLGDRTVHLSYDVNSPSLVTEEDVRRLKLRTLKGEKVELFDEQMVKYDDAGAKEFDEFSGPYTSVKLTRHDVWILRFAPRMYPPSTSVLSFKIVLQQV